MKYFTRRQEKLQNAGNDGVFTKTESKEEGSNIENVLHVNKNDWELISGHTVNLQPVVLLRNIFQKQISEDDDEKNGMAIKSKCSPNFQPVVLLEKVEVGITPETRNKPVNKTSKQEYNDCSRWTPVVVVVDVFQELHLTTQLTTQQLSPMHSSNWSNLNKNRSMDLKVSELEVRACTLFISVPIITQLLVDAVSLGNAPSRHNRPFDLTNPREECEAIAKALCIYADHVPPEEFIYLFSSNGHPQNNFPQQSTFQVEKCPDSDTTSWMEHLQKRVHNSLPSLIPRSKPPQRGIQRQLKKKGWNYITTLGSSDFFLMLKRTPRGKEAFEKKMLAIMKAALGVDPYNWTMSEVGYILGYWLAKLCNDKGIPDENLPKELVLAKEHFLELYGLHYNDAIVVRKPN